MGDSPRTEVTVHGLVHEVEIHDLSPTSAYVVGLPALEVDTKVAIAIISADGTRVSTLGQAKYSITPEVATRFRVRPGTRVELRDPVSPEDERFAMVISALVNERSGGSPAMPTLASSLDFQPTLRLTAPSLMFLTGAMNQLDAATKATAAFVGALDDLDVPSLLSMLELGRKSGRLELDHAGVRVVILLSKGRIVDASSSPVDGDPIAVLDDVIEWKEGQFQLHALEPEKRVIDLGVTQVLIEHAQRLDEAGRR